MMDFLKKYKNYFLAGLLFAVILAVDLITKEIVASNMNVYDTIPVIKDVFHITYVQNTGAAFSILEDQMLFFYILTPIALVAFSAYLFVVRKKSKLQNIAIILILSGTVGNFVDRILFQYVRDMFDFRVINFAVFNVADMALTVGVALFIGYLLVELVQEIKAEKLKKASSHQDENKDE